MTSRFGRGLVLAVLSLAPTGSSAADDPSRELADQVRAIAAEIRTVRANPSLDQDRKLEEAIAFANRRQRFFLLYCVLREQWGTVLTLADIASGLSRAEMAAAEEARTDVQPGATAGSSGTTSLLSKGSGPSYFGLAMESGPFMRSVGATTTTFQGNLIGLFDVFASNDYLAGYDDDRRITRFLRRFSGSFTLRNTAPLPADATGIEPSAPEPVTDRIEAQLRQIDERLEQWRGRAIVGHNRRDPRDEVNRLAIEQLMRAPAQGVLASLDDALETLTVSDEYQDWIDQSALELKNVPLPFLEGALIQRLNALCDLAKQLDRDFPTKALVALRAYAAFLSARDRLLEDMERRPLFAVEYVRTRQAFQKDLATYRLIAEGQSGRWDFTGNAAYSGYDQTPLGGGSLYRDFQIGVEAATLLGGRSLSPERAPLGHAFLSFGFLFERLSESATVTFLGRPLVAPAGNMFIGQMRVSIPIKNSGVRVPLSVSFSNRTELIEEKQMRAHLGFTFNYAAVASLLKK